MRIVCIGGGPAGLYFAVLAKRADPSRGITVYERGAPDDTFGFGVVFSDASASFLAEQDRHTYPAVMAHALRWDAITVLHRGRTMRVRNVGFAAVERRRLLAVLREEARALGVELVFGHRVADPRDHAAADLLIGCDGVHSTVREVFADSFQPRVEVGPTRFTWLGTDRPYEGLTFLFSENEHGRFGAHVYPYRPDRSTFIVETDEETAGRAGLDGFTEADTIAYCERLFPGHRLLANRSAWQRFRTVRCATWRHGSIALLGDAAHTAHFSVGSGTRMAMEDALALARALERCPGDVPQALGAFEEQRRPRVRAVQDLAATSFDWWAEFRRYTPWPGERFSFHFLTRSQFRADTLADRDPAYVAAVAAAAGFDPAERAIAVEPPEGDRAALARLAAGHPLALTRVLPVSEVGRVTAEDGRLEDYADLAARLPLGTRLTHAGPRGATRPLRLGVDRPLPEADAWPLLAASALPYAPGGLVPRAMDEADMARAIDEFARAAATAARLGFRFLQLQFGHGHLVGTFISPLTNRRRDAYGGPVERRLRFPLAVLDAARAAFPNELAVAISATDWQRGGLPADEALTVARRLRAHGADFVTALGGQTTCRSAPPYGRCYQALIAGRIQNEAGVPTIAAGGVTNADDARTILLAGRAERCLLDPGVSYRPPAP
ncbi:MAG TPA: FAD-dependent monooxygenase [Candidatus Dormibacteraeota bacterium]|nr:FAD-dependent monooxygenase [Candidatus Dormibacteraeota bacterium]